MTSEGTAPSSVYSFLLFICSIRPFSRAPWRGRPKAKPRRAPRQVKAKENLPELTVEQLSSRFAYLSAVPCLVLSCNSIVDSVDDVCAVSWLISPLSLPLLLTFIL